MRCGDGSLAHLQRDIRNHTDEITVAGALAVAVDGALHLRRAGVHGNQRIGHAEADVVVGVNADVAGKFLARGGGDGGHFARQRTAVRVTQHHKIRPGLLRRKPCCHRIFGVVLVAVERVLCVVDDFLPLLFQEPNRVGDHRQILLRSGAQYLFHVQQPRLAKESDHRCLSGDEQVDLRVVLGGDFLAARRTESGNLGVLPLALGRLFEKLDVLRVAPRPTALHVMHTKVVQLFGYTQLVRNRETHAFALRAVTQCRVINLNQILHQKRRVAPPRP